MWETLKQKEVPFMHWLLLHGPQGEKVRVEALEYCILADAYSIHWVFGVSLRCSRVVTQVDSHIASCLYILS